jgi:hypothetical protein
MLGSMDEDIPRSVVEMTVILPLLLPLPYKTPSQLLLCLFQPYPIEVSPSGDRNPQKPLINFHTFPTKASLVLNAIITRMTRKI